MRGVRSVFFCKAPGSSPLEANYLTLAWPKLLERERERERERECVCVCQRQRGGERGSEGRRDVLLAIRQKREEEEGGGVRFY